MESKINKIVGTNDNPVQLESGQVIINKKSTKKYIKKLVEINEDGENKTTTDGTDGGILKGKPHYDKNGNPTGGIPAKVDGERTIEVEGDEFVVNKEASEKHWKELSKINTDGGNGVPINKPSHFDDDPQEYKKGGKIIEFNPNHVPPSHVIQYALKIKNNHPKIWKLGGNIFGNEAFENLYRAYKRGYWLDSEEWMYIKWRSYVARHKRDFRIEGVIAMLKWADKVEKGWSYMKNLIQERIDKSKAKKKFNKGGLIAPNGKPSNLTSEQYKLVRTPEFKKWFGDWENDSANASKVVDENGEPLVVYHGTTKDFNEFNYSQNAINDFGIEGRGFYFSNKEGIAKQYAKRYIKELNDFDSTNGRVIEVFLKIVNPASRNETSVLMSRFKDFKTNAKETQIELIKKGFNGVIKKYPSGDNAYEFVVFESEQIKLADGTNTTFDGSNPDIRFKEGGTTKAEWIIDGKEATQEDFIEIYQRQQSNRYGGGFDFNPKKVEYLGDNEGSIRAVKDYNRIASIYDRNGEFKQVYMKAIISKALNETTFVKFGNAFRKHINSSFKAKNHELNKNSWREVASYVIGDIDYNISENDFRNFAKELGIDLPKNENSNPDIRFDEGGNVEDLISKGIVELKMFDTTPEHAKEYDIIAKKPLYVQTFCISEPKRLKGLGKKVLAYIEKYAIENGHDVVFGHITQKAKFSKDNRQTFYSDVEMIKNWLHSKGYSINEENNDFHKVINSQKNPDIRYEGGGKIETIIKKVQDISESKEHLNCESFCYRVFDNRLFKSEFEDVKFKLKSRNVDSRLKELISQLEVGDIIAWGEKTLARHYSIYAGDGKVFEVEGWGANPRQNTLADNIREYEGVSHIYRDNPDIRYEGGEIEKHIEDLDSILGSGNRTRSFITKLNQAKLGIEHKYHDYELMPYHNFVKNYDWVYIPSLDYSRDKLSIDEKVKNLVSDGYIVESKTYAKKLRKQDKTKGINIFAYKLKLNKISDSSNPNIRLKEGGLIAPNGNKSNLTPEQYKLVRTPEFKAWFGDWEKDPKNSSKVVDENGEPLVVYRGMSENVSNKYKFDFKTQLMTSHKRFNKFGFYFTDNLATANGYAKAFAENQSFEQAKELYKTEGKQTSYDEIKEKSKNYEVVISYFLNLKNFLNLTPSNPKFPKYKEGQLINFSTDYEFKDTAISLVELLDLLDLKQDYIDYISVVRNINLNDDWANLKKDVFTYFTEFKGGKSYGLKSLAQYLKEKILKKYDGVVFFESMYSPSNIYVAFSSNQIKLADGTNTTFDGNNPDIRFSDGGGIKELKKSDYKSIIAEKQTEKANELRKKLISEGFKGISNPNSSKTDFGVSTYFIFYDDFNIMRKFRISDHSVTNIDRIWNEYHYTENTDLNALVDRVKADINQAKQNNLERNKLWEADKEKTNLADKKWDEIKSYFVGLTFKHNDRTYQNLEEFSKNKNRSNIYQKSLGTNKYGEEAFYYEWTEPIKPNEMPKLKPSREYIEQYKNDGLRSGSLYHLGGDMSKHLAPNGKPSNLNHEQWHLVRTPAFKKWFGDWENDPENASKVVDENGEPMVVYHGSVSHDIDVFDRNKSKRTSSGLKEFGTYFATNKKLAKAYKDWAELDSSYKKELDKEIYKLEQIMYEVRNNREFDILDNKIKDLQKVKAGGKIYEVFLNIKKMASFDAKGKTNIEAWNNLEVKASYKWATNRDAMDFLKEGKFGVEKVDGIEARNIVDAFVQTEDLKKELIGNVYLVFDSHNIKLADGTNTTFDGDNPDIRYADGGIITSKDILDNPNNFKIIKSFDAKYVASFGVENGKPYTNRTNFYSGTRDYEDYPISDESGRRIRFVMMLADKNNYEKYIILSYDGYIRLTNPEWWNKIKKYKSDTYESQILIWELLPEIEKNDFIKQLLSNADNYDRSGYFRVDVALNETPFYKLGNLSSDYYNKFTNKIFGEKRTNLANLIKFEAMKVSEKMNIIPEKIIGVPNYSTKPEHKNKDFNDNLDSVIKSIYGTSENENKMKNGGTTDDFDYMSLFNISAEDEEKIKQEIKKSEEQEKEDWYQSTNFCKKWASTYQDAINKTVKEYLDAKATYEDWGSRQYKENKGMVFLGGDDIFGQAKSIGSINEGRRRNVLKGAKMQMDEAIETLKELKLSDEEISNLLENKMEKGGSLGQDIEMISTKYLDSIRTQDKSNWNYDFEKSIENRGILEPVVITYYPEDNLVALTDGHHRLDIAIDLGIEKIPAKLVLRYDNPLGKIKVYNSPNFNPNAKKPSDLGIYEKGGITESHEDLESRIYKEQFGI